MRRRQGHVQIGVIYAPHYFVSEWLLARENE